MLLAIPEVLSAEQVEACRAACLAADWVDGGVTAGFQSGKVKRNRQLPQTSPAAAEIGGTVLAALRANPLFNAAALPAHVYPPLVNRYDVGDGFGNHVDNAIREVPSTGARLRTDLSATLFFSQPADYDGGELVIDDTFGPRAVKLPAGHMVLYPATSVHRVLPVTRGVRLAAFFWVQSYVGDDSQRALLFDLDMAIVRLRRQSGESDITLSLTGVYHNLLRQWAAP
jgi:PKHD-type hydroxylase